MPNNVGVSIKNMQLSEDEKGKPALISCFYRNKMKVRHDREERHGGW